jgi:hypothetical protein
VLPEAGRIPGLFCQSVLIDLYKGNEKEYKEEGERSRLVFLLSIPGIMGYPNIFTSDFDQEVYSR